MHLILFQSTRPRGARRSDNVARPTIKTVSIHAPAWGATNALVDILHAADVSIHAPAWGATYTGKTKDALKIVSIHAPAWGATDEQARKTNELKFQSTRPRGARQIDLAAGRYCRRVSIHAPAWGATPISLDAYQVYLSFNPRARVGRDLLVLSILAANTCFNPRARVGRDMIVKEYKSRLLCFNPRARVGRDRLVNWKYRIDREFQSTRPRGARLKYPASNPIIIGFNPRARVGRDMLKALVESGQIGFNPRARVGRDNFRANSGSREKVVSIHAPAWGATYRRSNFNLLYSCFNPRARVGRDYHVRQYGI